MDISPSTYHIKSPSYGHSRPALVPEYRRPSPDPNIALADSHQQFLAHIHHTALTQTTFLHRLRKTHRNLQHFLSHPLPRVHPRFTTKYYRKILNFDLQVHNSQLRCQAAEAKLKLLLIEQESVLAHNGNGGESPVWPEELLWEMVYGVYGRLHIIERELEEAMKAFNEFNRSFAYPKMPSSLDGSPEKEAAEKMLRKGL